VAGLQEALTALRVFIEAALDFPDEEIDFIAESDVLQQLAALQESLALLTREAAQGQTLRDGITVAIMGVPNAGKSSLLNALAGRDAAIVTDVPGTTRDVLRETLSLDGLPVHLADTAGIREAGDVVEREGIRRARATLQNADVVLLVMDPSQPPAPQEALRADVPPGTRCIVVHNKADLVPGKNTGLGIPRTEEQGWSVQISAVRKEGLAGLVTLLHRAAGLQGEVAGAFSARRRHLDALRRAGEHLELGRRQLVDLALPETLAEELRLAQQALGELTGEFLPDDLLGAIFSSFCIGK
jgi:tRNA modification GTPase